MGDNQTIQQSNALSEDDQVQRTQRITIRISPEEIEVIDAKRKLVHERTISSYIRRMAVFGKIYFVDNEKIKKVNQSLSGIRGSLNQIAKRLNSTDRIYQDDLKEIARMREAIDRVQAEVAELKSMVSAW